MTSVGLNSHLKPRIVPFILLAVVISAVLLNTFILNKAFAEDLSNRSISLSSNQPSQNVSHSFQFFVPSTDTLGSIVFEYCTNSAIQGDVCAAPAGLDVTGANITAQVGNTGFSVDNVNTTANRLQITRVPLAASVIQTTLSFNNIINPSTAGQVVYVRIAIYSSADGSGSFIHDGSVAFVTSTNFNVTAHVPPFLNLCVGISVAVNCSSTIGDSIDLGTLTSAHASSGQSQFSAGTNSATGYAVYALGTTMTSGNNTISALSSPSPSFPGNNQFGINLRANTNPTSGQDPGGSGTAIPNPSYAIANQFVFNPGDQIVSAIQTTDYNRMTVSYLVNVNNAEPIGVYSTTLTYVAVAQF